MAIVVPFLQVLLLALLGLTGFVGLLAVISPTAFAVMCTHGSQVVRSSSETRADRWIDLDQYVLEHSRPFGLAIIASEGLIWFTLNHGPEVYSKSFLLISFCVVLLVGVLALGHVLRQQRQIEAHLVDARTDALTGLANRRAFDEELSRRLAQRQRQGTPLCLMIIDVDRFKSFNDHLGHLEGDAILKEIADTLLGAARHMDIVARLGGDEFAVILPGSNLDEAGKAAERFRRAISDNPTRCTIDRNSPTISSGVVEAQLDDDVVSLIKRADSALYAAKEAGRNCSFRHGGPEPLVPDLMTPDLTLDESGTFNNLSKQSS
ncbi:MAG: hypothetical protein CMJ64_15865 [Planctomycetaceae bacterium]|nr:hypothetical protein [Planctomycetaceae bacterium]